MLKPYEANRFIFFMWGPFIQLHYSVNVIYLWIQDIDSTHVKF